MVLLMTLQENSYQVHCNLDLIQQMLGHHIHYHISLPGPAAFGVRPLLVSPCQLLLQEWHLHRQVQEQATIRPALPHNCHAALQQHSLLLDLYVSTTPEPHL
jgi:hypothetical protein